MKVSVYLADAATADPSGKVNALGLGWSFIGTPMPLHSIIAIVELDQAEAGREHRLVGELLDEDGRPALLAEGSPAFRFEGGFRVDPAAPGALPAGAVLTQAFPITVPPGIALPGGRRWEYRVTVGDAIASVGFATRPV